MLQLKGLQRFRHNLATKHKMPCIQVEIHNYKLEVLLYLVAWGLGRVRCGVDRAGRGDSLRGTHTISLMRGCLGVSRLAGTHTFSLLRGL